MFRGMNLLETITAIFVFVGFPIIFGCLPFTIIFHCGLGLSVVWSIALSVPATGVLITSILLVRHTLLELIKG